MEYIESILTGILTAIIGAVPFGLVNLSVMDNSFHKGYRHAMKIAHGATIVEICFGIIALFIGAQIHRIFESYIFLRYTIMGVIASVGIVFLLKRSTSLNKGIKKNKISGLIEGMILNIISIQVFIYWIVAISFILSLQILTLSTPNIFLFITGIWLGKIGVLWLYATLSNWVLSKSKILSKNINRIIGSILLLTAISQWIRL